MKGKFEYYITTVCAGCGRKLKITEVEDPKLDGKMSHGSCDECAEEDLKELEEML